MELFALAVALALSGPVALVIALGLRKRMASMQTHIDALTRELRAARAAPSTSGAVPASPTSQPQDASTAQSADEAPDVRSQPDLFATPVTTASEPQSWYRREPAAVEPTTPQALQRPLTSSSPPAASARTTGLEQIVGTSWTVRIGGVALAFGGLLLVRYSIEQGLVGPAVRCLLGLCFAFVLTGAGEWLRRREKRSEVPTITPAILTAAGTVVAFGAIYAAHGLYGFIGPALAFIALGAIAVASIFGAALHGPTLAGVGLLGAFVAPLIVNSDQPNPWPVVIYLAVATGAAYALSRLRRWLWLARAASFGAAGWAVLFALDGSASFFQAALVHTLAATALASLFIAFLPSLEIEDENADVDPIASAALATFAAVGAFVMLTGIGSGHFSLTTVVLAGLLVAELAGIAAVTAGAATALPTAAAFVLAVLAIWPGDPERPIQLSTLTTLYEPTQPARFALFALFGAIVVGGIAVRRLVFGPALRLPITAIHAATATVAPLLILAAAWLRLAHSEASPPFTALAGLLAAVFALLVQRTRGGVARDAPLVRRLALGAFATGSLAAVALGLVFVLDSGMLTVALALSALAAAAVAARLELGGLRLAVAAMGFVVLGRLVWDPRIVGSALGTTPILNWLLIGYGVPALAFGGAARLLRLSDGEDLPVRVSQALAILFTALLAVFEIRHALHGGDLYARRTDLVEWGLYATTSLLFSLALLRIDLRRSAPVFEYGSLLFGALTAPVAALALFVGVNPLLNCAPLEGGAVLNALIPSYALPAIAAGLLARQSRGVRPEWFTTGAGALAVSFLFAYVSLETRRLFHDTTICSREDFGQVELWTYSAVWIVLGILLLLYGIVRKLPGARLASAALIFLSTLKVFLYDLSNLEGLARAFSFIGLGVALIGIGLLYQKLVFRDLFAKPGETPAEN